MTENTIIKLRAGSYNERNQLTRNSSVHIMGRKKRKYFLLIDQYKVEIMLEGDKRTFRK
jgi:hypothetical protein